MQLSTKSTQETVWISDKNTTKRQIQEDQDVNIFPAGYCKKVSEYDQEIPQSQTADNPMAPRGRAAQPSRDTRKTKLAKQPALFSVSR